MILILLFTSDFWFGVVKLRKVNHLEKDQWKMPIAWYPKRWWNLFMWEDENKEIAPIITE